MISASLNTLAEARELPAYTSWRNGKPAGTFDLSQLDQIVEFYNEHGFLVIENGFTEEEVMEIRAEAVALCRGERGTFPGLSEAIAGATDDEVIKNYLCIHFPHKLSELFHRYLGHKTFVDVLTRIIGPNVKCMQSMLFIKSAGKPGQAWHQDEIYIPTRDRTLTGGWIALDDANVENGCLWVIPGSHKDGILYDQEWHADPRFDCSLESRHFPYTNDDAVPVEVKAGSVVFFNGYLLHRSLPNYREVGYRRSLVNHYMSAESLLPWAFHMEVNTQVGALDNRDIVMVAGRDPYAHKGITKHHGGHVRPDGKGGCGNLEYNLAAGDDHDH